MYYNVNALLQELSWIECTRRFRPHTLNSGRCSRSLT